MGSELLMWLPIAFLILTTLVNFCETRAAIDWSILHYVQYGLTSGSSSDDDIRDICLSVYVALIGPPNFTQAQLVKNIHCEWEKVNTR